MALHFLNIFVKNHPQLYVEMVFQFLCGFCSLMVFHGCLYILPPRLALANKSSHLSTHHE